MDDGTWLSVRGGNARFNNQDEFRWGLALASVLVMAMAKDAATPGDADPIRDRQSRLLDEQRRRLEDL